MSNDRKRLIVRRSVLAAILVPLLYCSSFVTASFLHGAGVVSGPAFQLLCETAFAPLLWIDGGNQVAGGRFRISPGPSRLPWLFDTAYEFANWGYKLTH